MTSHPLFEPLPLPCGVVIKNRIIKSAMSDSLGDGTGHPTQTQGRLYERWAMGGLAASIVGEVQAHPRFAEKPGNLVLNAGSDLEKFKAFATRGQVNDALLWLQLGHAGAMSYPPISAPRGPSAIDIPGLICTEMTLADIHALPASFAKTAQLAQEAGFGGVQLHAAHGFLLSQFLSPLFNKRTDAYGEDITGRMRIVLEVLTAMRAAVGPRFPIAIKLNATDQLEGGLEREDALAVIAALDRTSVDLIDISGGTYFPGARAASDSAGSGPYFVEFARLARAVTGKPLMVTGGFKTLDQVQEVITAGDADVIGLARALVIDPDLPNAWAKGQQPSPGFPKFRDPPEGGITAWYTMRLTAIGEDREGDTQSLNEAIEIYEARDAARTRVWNAHFGTPSS